VAVALVSEGAAFCAVPPRDAADCDAAANAWDRAADALARVGPPTLAVLAADALGPAWALALACDLRLAAREARVGSPEVRWGRLPAAGVTQRLPRLAGPGVALRLLLLGEVLGATDAHALGLVHRVAPAAALDATREELLGELRAAAPIALGYTKEAIHQALELPLPAGLRLEADLAALLQTTHDRVEGLTAYHQRRAPSFEAR
jgi:enoyl-CoA hydratase